MIKKKFIITIKLIIFFSIFSFSKADEIFTKGKEIFLNKGNCQSCHVLSEAKSMGTIGPNLNDLKPDKQRIIMAVSNGIGVMPAYQNELSLEEIDAVAHYVSTASQE